LYPSTLEEDVEILKDESLTYNQRNCVLFRLGEKEILVFLIQTAKLIKELMQGSQKEAKARLVSFKYYKVCDNYVKDSLFKLIQ